MNRAAPPRHRIALACSDRGPDAVIDGCLALLGGVEADEELVGVLGGVAGPRYLDAPPDQSYWLRVWGARGLLWAPWQPRRRRHLRGARRPGLASPRDAAKVVVRHQIGESFEAVTAILHDPVPRVRIAAARALRLLTAAVGRDPLGLDPARLGPAQPGPAQPGPAQPGPLRP